MITIAHTDTEINVFQKFFISINLYASYHHSVSIIFKHSNLSFLNVLIHFLIDGVSLSMTIVDLTRTNPPDLQI